MKKYMKFALILFPAIILVFIVIPSFINWAYKSTSIFDWMSVDWDAEDFLLYFGSALSGVGAIYLGIVTLLQNNRIRKDSADKEKSNIKRPFFYIHEVSFSKQEAGLWRSNQNGFSCKFTKEQYAYIKVINIGDGIANNLIIEPWWFGDDIPHKKHRPTFCCMPNNYLNIPINLKAKDNNATIDVEIIYQNIIGYAFTQKIEVFIEQCSEQVGEDVLEDNMKIPEYHEYFQAHVFHIHPQIPLGMDKYDTIKGVYM